MATLAPFFKQQFFDDNGIPLAGGKVYSYAAGTSTPLNTYTDQGGLTPNANPVILDSSGSADIWLGTALYKLVIADANDIVVKTVDNVSYASSGAVGTTQLADSAATTAKIADLAITTAKLADDAVTTDKIDEDAVQTVNILNSAVTTAKINDLAVTTAKLADGAVTQDKRAPLGAQVSSSCGTYINTSTSYVDATNLTVTITTTGRSVYLALIPVGTTATPSNINPAASGSFLTFNRGGTDISVIFLVGSRTVVTTLIDTPAAGSHTYKIRHKTGGSGTTEMTEFSLVALEL